VCVWIVFQFNTKSSPMKNHNKNTKKANWRLIMWIVVAQSWPIYEIFFKWIKHVRACRSEAIFGTRCGSWKREKNFHFHFIVSAFIIIFINIVILFPSCSLFLIWMQKLCALLCPCLYFTSYFLIVVGSFSDAREKIHIVNLMDLKIQFGGIMVACCWRWWWYGEIW